MDKKGPQLPGAPGKGHEERESGLCYPILHNARERKRSSNDQVRS